MSALVTAVQLLLPLIQRRDRPEAESIGRAVYEEIRGAEPRGPLDEALSEMDEDEQEEWARVMQLRLDMFVAETERLEGEQGRMDAETLGVLSVEDRGRVAWLRMTTRPWGVRLMILGLVSPFLLVAIDVGFYVINVIVTAVSLDHLLSSDPNGWSVYNFELSNAAFNNEGLKEFYLGFKGWAAAIVISYFGFREIGKINGIDDGKEQSLTGAVSAVGGAMKQVKKNFEGVRDVFRVISKRL